LTVLALSYFTRKVAYYCISRKRNLNSASSSARTLSRNKGKITPSFREQKKINKRKKHCLSKGLRNFQAFLKAQALVFMHLF